MAEADMVKINMVEEDMVEDNMTGKIKYKVNRHGLNWHNLVEF